MLMHAAWRQIPLPISWPAIPHPLAGNLFTWTLNGPFGILFGNTNHIVQKKQIHGTTLKRTRLIYWWVYPVPLGSHCCLNLFLMKKMGATEVLEWAPQKKPSYKHQLVPAFKNLKDFSLSSHRGYTTFYFSQDIWGCLSSSLSCFLNQIVTVCQPERYKMLSYSYLQLFWLHLILRKVKYLLIFYVPYYFGFNLYLPFFP